MTYCIGDIHGDRQRMTKLLQEVSLIGDEREWTGGDATLVFIGDYTDRDRHGVEVIQDIMRLAAEAESAGGEVISLLGNHDALMYSAAMELLGHEVHHDLAGTFIGNGGRIQEAERIAGDPTMLEWLRTRPGVAKVGDTLFQHVDSVKIYTRSCEGPATCEGINAGIAKYMESPVTAFDLFCDMCDYRAWDTNDDVFDHLRWSQSLEKKREKRIVDSITQYMSDLGVAKIVHGHTRHLYRVPLVYFDGRIVNVDGSLSHGYRSEPWRGFVYEVQPGLAVS